ncbi:MAG: haloalkane dehalogenase, partial [Woeseiaceae bacterium]|nr:haloalkane dehalogenase [Woeseiaceae bacterium]
MQALRTPESRFENLPDYPFEPHYVDIDGLRMHYVDEGPASADPVLLLHGEPSWSFLYRHMIPPLVAAGHRVIAPDLVGFGKSDKPSSKSAYSYAGHVDWMRRFIERIDLHDITLFCQDWGSLIGLRVAAENEHRFARIALGNGGLPTGDQAMPRAFLIWRTFALYSPWFPIGRIIQSGTVADLPPAVVAAYDA